ncbi:NAD(P)/FAD-dependent oxidoreductase [Streptomyces sp. C36]|uniref:NAD(P)/FAD-dependent oxidoreductase n=1 Tax=Streptomyces sp. C36 TaxID=3237122 RepID=UPI0034C616D5
MAARVLSDHADEVVVLEQDEISENGLGPGAPHRAQLHALLAMGHMQLERWFPGIVKELIADGAQLGTGTAIQFYVDNILKVPVPDTEMIGATRPFIEAHLRSRVAALPNVELRTAQARDLIISGDQVRGVRFSSASDGRHSATPDGELAADLVVDAMGRSSRLSSWLEHHGWEQPPLHRLRVDLGYATAFFQRGDELPGTQMAQATPGPASSYRPAITEPGALTAVEGNRWSVVLAGYTDYRPSRDPEQFLTRMRRCVPPLQEVANQCAMVDDEVKTYHFRESIKRDFASLGRLPRGLMAIGDALASVNPIYGQGLTLATLQASCLSAHLQAGGRPQDSMWGYFRRARAVVDAAWQLSSTADLAQPHVTGPYPPGYRLLRWAGDKVMVASIFDPVVNQAFMDVLHMKAHPRTLTNPRLLKRAARAFAIPAA